MYNNDPDDLLMNTGRKLAKFKFERVGDTIVGTVINKSVRQSTDFKTKAPKTFPSGDPVQELVITLSTDLRDPEFPDDDGTRKVYAEQDGRVGSKFLAIQVAVRESGAKGLEIGGQLAVQLAGAEPVEGTRNERYLWRAQFAPPADQLLNQAAPGAAPTAPLLPPAPQAQPVAQPAPAPAPQPVAQAPAGDLFAQPAPTAAAPTPQVAGI